MSHLVIFAQLACINTFLSCPCGRPNLLDPNETEPHGDLPRPVVFKRLLSVMLVHVLVLVAFLGPLYHFANPACLLFWTGGYTHHNLQLPRLLRAAQFRLPENSTSSLFSFATWPLPLFFSRMRTSSA